MNTQLNVLEYTNTRQNKENIIRYARKKIRKQVTIDANLSKIADQASLNLSSILNEALKEKLTSQGIESINSRDKMEFKSMINAHLISAGGQYNLLTSKHIINDVLDDLIRVIHILEENGLEHAYETKEATLVSKNNYFTSKLLRLKFILNIDNEEFTLENWTRTLTEVRTSDILSKLELSNTQRENLVIALRSLGSIISFLIFTETEITQAKNYTYLLHRFEFALETFYIMCI